MAPRFDPETTCLHLRSKQMAYEDPATAPMDEESSDIDTTVYWCQCTQTGRGPDAKPVRKDLCCPGRTCFENVSSLI